MVNKGIALSLFADTGILSQNSLIFIISLVIAIFTRHLIKRWLSNFNILPEIIVCAGGLGNLISRAAYGGVVDFLEVSLYGNYSSILNIADIYISLGLGIILLRTTFYEST
jgi:signal peptidase II